jgi:hypothetical protein
MWWIWSVNVSPSSDDWLVCVGLTVLKARAVDGKDGRARRRHQHW